MAIANIGPRVLPDLAAQFAEMQSRMAALEAENEALRAAKASGKGITLKVSEKGAISIYGLGQWPITLYRSQFEKLDAHWADVQAFAKANVDRLTVKAK